MRIKTIGLFISCFVFLFSMALPADETLILKDNLQRARAGDYVVLCAHKTDTLMLILSKDDERVVIEEIAVPARRRRDQATGWREWVAQDAPGNTSWVTYEIDLKTGKMGRYYSYTKKGWFEISDADNFLSKILNLSLHRVPEKLCKRVGPKPALGEDRRPLWHPPVIVEGRMIDGVAFNVWKTRWPKDSSDLSGKTLELYLPQENDKYPSYFPYWLQISGAVGSAKVRMVDSGTNLKSPKESRI